MWFRGWASLLPGCPDWETALEIRYQQTHHRDSSFGGGPGLRRLNQQLALRAASKAISPNEFGLINTEVSDSLNNLIGGDEENEGDDLRIPTSSDHPTQPYLPGEMRPEILPDPSIPFPIGIGSSVGMRRDHNEDALFAMTANLVSKDPGLPMGLFIVADGMGGHVHGEIASQLAVQAMADRVLPKIIPPLLGLAEKNPRENLEEIMTEGVRAAHAAIQEEAPGGGSTLTGLLLLGEHMTIAHIGDSRAYHFVANEAPRVLTTDHSLVKRLEDLGQITPDEAAIHPQRNILYRALGQVEQVDAEIIFSSKPTTGYLAVCSDGLWGAVPDEEMLRIILRSSDPQKACDNLLGAANSAGGPDNISVIIIKIPEKSRTNV